MLTTDRPLDPAGTGRSGRSPRGLRVLGVSAVATASVVLSAGSAVAAPPESIDSAAAWLVGQLTDVDGDGVGERVTTSFDLDGNGEIDPATELYPDQGLTADVLIGLILSDGPQASIDAVTAYLEEDANTPETDTYFPYPGDGTASSSYPGPLAKLAVATELAGGDPTDFAGIDLIARLLEREQDATGANPGRFSNTGEPLYDNSNAFTQALAILALDGAGVAPSTAAIDSLLSLQCADGGFRLYYAAGVCDTEANVSDTDATAFVVQALLALGDSTAGGAGLDFLASRIDPATGGIGGTGPTAALNSNSSGLALQALRADSRCDAVLQVEAYVLGNQVTEGADAGAIDYDGAAFDAGSALRSTAQAITGLTEGALFVADGAAAEPCTAAAPEPEPGPAPDPAPAPLPGDPGTPPPGGDSGGAPQSGITELSATGAAPVGLLETGAGLVLVGVALNLLTGRRARTEA